MEEAINMVCSYQGYVDALSGADDASWSHASMEEFICDAAKHGWYSIGAHTL